VPDAPIKIETIHCLFITGGSRQMDTHDQLIQALTQRSVYAHPTTEITVLQTHISWVVLTGPYAYKIKKPVNLGFVDFSTLAKRHFFCQEELRLNRRLAPHLYLEVVAISGTPECPRLHAKAPPIEYAVKMRQFPQDQLLSHLLAAGTLQASHTDQLAHEVSAFHARIATATPESPFGTPEMIYQPVHDNFQHLFDTIDDPIRQAHARELETWCQHTFAARRGDMLARKRDGFVRECHGDMHLGNMILLDEAVVIFDCLEFNESLRWIDVASEVAFVTMDLEDRGRPDLAYRFLNGYIEATGDYGLLGLLPFYLTYRATVRAKVAGIRLEQSHLLPEEVQHVREEFGSYLDLATRYTRPSPPRLFITHGVSGSGKSAGTQQVIEAIGAIRLRSDVERKRLFGLDPLERSTDHSALGLYAPAVTQRTYAHLAQQAARVVQAGFSAVIDATFLQRAQRDAFQRLAATLGVPFTILAFQARDETLRHRVARRSAQANDASEADLAVLQGQLAAREPLAADEQTHTITIDTDVPQVFDHLRETVCAMREES
jgi:aminoglycoside phosphotransferase family enzyme/predicted kinase